MTEHKDPEISFIAAFLTYLGYFFLIMVIRRFLAVILPCCGSHSFFIVVGPHQRFLWVCKWMDAVQRCNQKERICSLV
jgi:hypothetical protein